MEKERRKEGKGKKEKERRKRKRTKKNFSIGEEGNSNSSGDGNRVMVIIREKKGVRQGRIERGRKDDVEPAGHLPTWVPYDCKRSLGNSVCVQRLDGKPTLPTLGNLT